MYSNNLFKCMCSNCVTRTIRTFTWIDCSAHPCQYNLIASSLLRTAVYHFFGTERGIRVNLCIVSNKLLTALVQSIQNIPYYRTILVVCFNVLTLKSRICQARLKRDWCSARCQSVLKMHLVSFTFSTKTGRMKDEWRYGAVEFQQVNSTNIPFKYVVTTK